MDKLEGFQKQCIKWILSEEYSKYGTYEVYLQKCRQVRLLPLIKRFEYNDLVLFFKVIHSLIPLKLPSYLQFYEGNSRLRSCHLDSFCLVSSVSPKSNVISDSNKNSPLYKSFYYRVHLEWNSLPLELRQISILTKFKSALINYLWKSTLAEISENADYLDTWDDLGDTFQ